MEINLPITAMIVDEDEERRASLRRLLIGARMGVVAECGFGIDGPTTAGEVAPDVVFIAVEEPSQRALRAIQNFKAANPLRPVIAHSTIADLDVFRAAMRAGVNDFLPQPLESGQVYDSVLTALRAAGAEIEGEGENEERGKIITVFGPKGGIGKSTISANLAAGLRRATEGSVLLIDFDLFFGDVSTLTGVEGLGSTAELAARARTLDRNEFFDALVIHEGTGVSVLPSAPRPRDWTTASAEQLQDLLDFAARYFDYVVVDTPGTFTESVVMAVEMSERALLVSSFDTSSIKDTGFVLSFLADSGVDMDKIKLVLNHTGAVETFTRAQIESSVGAPVFWEVPKDREVARATQTGQLVAATAPGSRAALSIADMACRLSGVQAVVRPGAGRFFGIARREGNERRALA